MSEAAADVTERPSTPTFLQLWEELFLFTEHGRMAKCLICGKELQQIKKYNLQCHYTTCHAGDYDKYTGEDRVQLVAELKSNPPEIQDNSVSESAVRVSFKLSLEIAKKLRPYSDGEFIKDCIIMTAAEFFPNQVHECEAISLSPSTVMRRIQDMAGDVREQLLNVSKNFIAFSLALDESTDISDTAQLAIFVRGVDANLQVREELLDLVPMHDRTTGLDIFIALQRAVEEAALPWYNFVSLATDGAPSMVGSTSGVVGWIKNKMSELNCNIVSLHCIIHQQNLCAKSINLNNVMSVVVKTTNNIRSRGLNHRQFKQFLQECDSEYGDLPYHSEVRWLSRGKVLGRFFELREAIKLFLEMQDKPVPELSDVNWICDLAFLADLTAHMNTLNVSLQGKNKFISDLFSSVKAFKVKLELWECQLTNMDTIHFPKLSSVFQSIIPSRFQQYARIIREVIEEFDTRFKEMIDLETDIKLFATPFSVAIDTIPAILQLEVIDLQNDIELRDKFKNRKNLTDFYSKFPRSRFPRLHHFAARYLSMFASTYICEQLFSLMKICKPRHRNQLSDYNLKCILRLCLSQSIVPNVEKLLKDKRIKISRRSSTSSTGSQ